MSRTRAALAKTQEVSPESILGVDAAGAAGAAGVVAAVAATAGDDASSAWQRNGVKLLRTIKPSNDFFIQRERRECMIIPLESEVVLLDCLTAFPEREL
jgi:hypothetical protein